MTLPSYATSPPNFSWRDCLVVRRFATLPYQPVWQAMQTFTKNRSESTPDELWLLQHQPVFTQGQAGKPEHILVPGDIPVVQVDRGGQVTYHGPGQLVGYILVDLARQKIGTRDLVSAIENTVIATLASFGVCAKARQDAPGVYVGAKKIASLGLRVIRGRSFHGLSLNVIGDLSPFQRINPCGYQGLEMVKLEDLVADIDFTSVLDELLKQFIRVMGYNSSRIEMGLPRIICE
ncbi:MAG: octanoyltransferase [Gammaproteobacteria bacterium]|nr:MAG: octanoyltransferase [Gammaproteobacteria bacterium]